MNDEIRSESPARAGAVGGRLPVSYDSGYEHSLDHWIELRRLVNEAENGPTALTVAVNQTQASRC